MIKSWIKRKSYNVLHYMYLYAGIVFLMAVVMGFCSYFFLYKTVHAEYLFSNRQHLTAIVNQHETNMKILDDIVKQMGMEENITRFKLEEQPKKTIMLKERLKSYNTVSQFFDLLLYHYHEDKYLYNYLSSGGVDYFLESGLLLEETTADELATLMGESVPELRILPEQETGGSWMRFYADGCGKYTIFLQTTLPYMEDTLIFLVPDTYYDVLLSDEGLGSSASFLYYEGRVIVGRGLSENTINDLFQERTIEEMLLQFPSGQSQVSIEKEIWQLSLEKGSSGIYYGTLQPKEVFWDKLKVEQWIVLLILGVCVFPALLAIIFASYRVIWKVRDLNELIKREKSYDLSNIENGIRALMVSHRESENESKILRKTRFISKFVRGEFHDREEAVMAASKADLQIDRACYMLVLLKNWDTGNEGRIHSFIQDAITEENEVDGYGIHLVSSNRNLYVLFANEPEFIEKMISKILEIVKQYSGEYVMAVSNLHEDFVESSRAYLEVDTAFDSHLLLGNDKLIRFDEVACKEYTRLLSDNYLRQLRHAIRSGDKAAVEMVVQDICSKINGQNASLYAFRIFCNDIIHVLISEWNGDRSWSESLYNVFTLSQCYNMQDFCDLLNELCKTIIDRSAGKSVEKSDIVQRALDYMEQNYQDSNLTMNVLARHLQISTVMLSVEFKNMMEISPSNYLANLRIKKAKELLRETDMLIKEISLAVGYEDDHVLTRWFKKYTGITPGQYREKQQN